MRRIDEEIAQIKRESVAFREKEEAIIEEVDMEEDAIRNMHHKVRSQLDRANQNVSPSNT